MSLLMKALEKAAKDRGQLKDAPGSGISFEPSSGEPGGSLNAFSADTPTLEERPAPTPAPPPPRSEPVARPVPPPAPAQTTDFEESSSPDPARAATVMNAGVRRPGFIAQLLARPVMMMSILGGVFAVGFGAYVYLQIFHPGMFIKKPPPAPAVVEQKAAPMPQSVPGTPVPASAVINAGAPEPAEQPAVAPAAPVTPATALAPPAPKPPAPPPAAPVETGARISVSQSTGEVRINPMSADAYTALESGRLEDAQRFYQQLVRTEPKNPEHLLGLAAVAVQQRRNDDATSLYLRTLELDPRNTLAQAGLLALVGRADPLAAETKLKQLISREPQAFLYFVLGNLYADQNLWAQAQQAFFQAFHMEPSRADYAYNLAVGLEHVGQPRFALSFYRRAVQLAESSARAGFDVPGARARISQLTPLVE